STVFSKLDHCQGYLMVPLHPGNCNLSAFVTPSVPQAVFILVCTSADHGTVGASHLSLCRWLPVACLKQISSQFTTEAAATDLHQMDVDGDFLITQPTILAAGPPKPAAPVGPLLIELHPSQARQRPAYLMDYVTDF
ncbi:hypothetical protein XENOCAPTIV_016898, partial [Xenoophorus captivus]